jgi:hypothetical protein
LLNTPPVDAPVPTYPKPFSENPTASSLKRPGNGAFSIQF